MSQQTVDPSQWPAHIQQRYGVRSRSRSRSRWLGLALAALGVGFAAVVTVHGWRIANPPIAAGLRTYQIVADDHVVIDFQVHRTEQASATCVLRARAEDGFDVAYAVVDLPAAQGRTEHSFDLRTAYRALVAEVLGCGVDSPPASAPGAQYRPGVVPPEQPWTHPVLPSNEP